MSKTLYLDLSGGISLDMLQSLILKLSSLNYKSINYNDLIKNVKRLEYKNIKNNVLNTYKILGEAEKTVHEEKTLSALHFHEVGREEAVIRIENIFYALEKLSIKKIIATHLTEGDGEIKTAHGILRTPVPVVRELAKKHKLQIKINKKIKTEILTPTALAVLLTKDTTFSDNLYKKGLSRIKQSETRTVFGTRKENTIGLKGFIL